MTTKKLSMAGYLVAPFAFAAAVSIGQAAVKPPSGELRAATLADLKPHPSSSKTYNEFWTYHFFLDGDIQAYLNFSRVNLGSFKDPVCGADLTVLGLKGRNHTVAREYKIGNFNFADAEARLNVHEKIWFQGRLPETHRVHFETVKKNVAYLVDLEFTEIVPGQVWGDGMFGFGSDKVGIFFHIPKARVAGTLAVGGDTVTVTGTAYMDHTFQTDLAPKLVGGGFRYITQKEPLEIGYFLNPAHGNGPGVAGYGLRNSDAGFKLLKPMGLKALSQSKAMGVKVPTSLEITYHDNTKAVVERSVDRQARSYLHEFDGIKKWGIMRFMGGEIISFKGMGKLNGAQPAAYNYFLVND